MQANWLKMGLLKLSLLFAVTFTFNVEANSLQTLLQATQINRFISIILVTRHHNGIIHYWELLMKQKLPMCSMTIFLEINLHLWNFNLSTNMVNYWTNFHRFGTPNGLNNSVPLVWPHMFSNSSSNVFMDRTYTSIFGENPTGVGCSLWDVIFSTTALSYDHFNTNQCFKFINNNQQHINIFIIFLNINVHFIFFYHISSHNRKQDKYNFFSHKLCCHYSLQAPSYYYYSLLLSVLLIFVL